MSIGIYMASAAIFGYFAFTRAQQLHAVYIVNYKN